MRKLFEKLHKDIYRFIEQRDDLLMVASCSDNDIGFVLQTLRDIEQASATDIFLLFADDFTQADPFVSVTVERLREQHRIVCEALAEKGKQPLPPFPSNMSDDSKAPALRLREAICFARSLVPREGGHRLAWAMFPQRISDRREYLQLVESFVPSDGVKPWMAGIRLVFRDEPGTAEYSPELASAPRVRMMNLDLGPAALEASTREDAEDKELPEEERMQALLSLAVLDYAHNRTNDAITKYNHLLAYYQRTENQTMQAFIINAFGDIYHRNGDLSQAQHWYECAVPPAATAKDPLILATVARNLGDVSYQLGAYREAEEYYDGVDKLSTVTLDAGSKIRALEWRGLSQEQQGKHDSAIQSWEAAALLSRKMNFPAFLKENLEHLVRGYRRLGNDKSSSVVAELSRLQQEVSPNG
jgi:tetratricopeptide (TPR) repeat protein